MYILNPAINNFAATVIAGDSLLSLVFGLNAQPKIVTVLIFNSPLKLLIIFSAKRSF